MYIVITLSLEDLPEIVSYEDGDPKIFETEEEAKDELEFLHSGMVVQISKLANQ